jgi:hypothetical protein
MAPDRCIEAAIGPSREDFSSEKEQNVGTGGRMSLSYTLIRSRRRKKTLSIQVEGDGTVIIRVPYRTPSSDIDCFFREKRQWLLKTIGRRQQRNSDRPVRSFIPGERFDYLGDGFPLNLRKCDDPGEALAFTGREFLLKPAALSQVRVLFLLWYQKQARLHLEGRVRSFSAMLGLSPSRVSIHNARSRWGSCSPDDRLRFTWRLIMAPPAIIDYVVVHELCHMTVRNHSGRYWRLVEQILPDYKQSRAWLRDHGHRLML